MNHTGSFPKEPNTVEEMHWQPSLKKCSNHCEKDFSVLCTAFFIFCESFKKSLPTFKPYKLGTLFSKSIEVLISQCTTSEPMLKGGVPSNITKKLMKSYTCSKLFVINSPLPGTVIVADQLLFLTYSFQTKEIMALRRDILVLN